MPGDGRDAAGLHRGLTDGVRVFEDICRECVLRDCGETIRGTDREASAILAEIARLSASTSGDGERTIAALDRRFVKIHADQEAKLARLLSPGFERDDRLRPEVPEDRIAYRAMEMLKAWTGSPFASIGYDSRHDPFNLEAFLKAVRDRGDVGVLAFTRGGTAFGSFFTPRVTSGSQRFNVGDVIFFMFGPRDGFQPLRRCAWRDTVGGLSVCLSYLGDQFLAVSLADRERTLWAFGKDSAVFVDESNAPDLFVGVQKGAFTPPRPTSSLYHDARLLVFHL